jgi:hypothetical protein
VKAATTSSGQNPLRAPSAKNESVMGGAFGVGSWLLLVDDAIASM